jgi:lantibiotic modifying enzyme
VSYLAAAEEAGNWLLATAERSPQGWCWPYQPGVSPEFAPGLGWGTAGPVLFFVEAFRTTGEERWLAAAREGSRWMAGHLDASLAEWAGCGLFTGVGGWAVVLDELAAAAGDEQAHDLAGRVLAAVTARASAADTGVHWHDLTEILWGTAGVGCLLLTLGADYLGPSALELAVRAGDWLLAEAEKAPSGIRWSLGRGRDAGRPGDPRRFPNFAHGTAGIGFFLARLAQVTGEQRFLDASLAGTEWIMTTVRTDGDTCAAYHHDPGGTELFTLGWCHGPPGLGWLFRQLELTTGATGWRGWLRRAARADLTSGIPERRGPGFWDNVARCCGSAGVAEFFLDLHRLEGRPADLAFAVTLVDDLLGRAISDRSGMRWSNYEFRLPAPDLPPETTYLQGAAGIGSTLLRLHRHLAGDPWTVRWPHAPSWGAAPGQPVSERGTRRPPPGQAAG